ncbi:MAG: translation elongation factor 4 [Candidatus Colwellbacteria bacterium]|nr:translation elongation factor 4 [Candidatus Colwellbacteria bacterium]
MNNVRNFVIIAHIDHGKSTLADRMLEITETIPAREMRPQYLDQMELERERGITIKMTPVRMVHNFSGKSYELNLIDTPGHSDFGYEVSRALTAVEGAVLLVDATQGIQAQTLANFEAAKKTGLTIIGCVNKIDLNPAGIDTIIRELALLIKCEEKDIFRVSAKTGEGVRDLIDGVVRLIPPPGHLREEGKQAIPPAKQALIFDSVYDDHKGIVAYARVFSGDFSARESMKLIGVNKNFMIKEVGVFSPEPKTVDKLESGKIGYIATGIKDPGVLRIGDTIGDSPLPGFTPPNPVVFVSLYPEDGSEYENLKAALNKLHLSDSSISLDPDYSEVLGRGFKAGFLGRLHFEIITARLEREFGIDVITSFPSVAYRVKTRSGKEILVESPKDFPEDNGGVYEPIVAIRIMAPKEYLGRILSLREFFRIKNAETESFDDNIIIKAKMPLSELVSDLDDKLKSISLGYASFSYELSEYEPAEVTKLEVLVAGEEVPGLTRIVYKEEAARMARKIAEELKSLLPKALFVQVIQVKGMGKILAREDISALKKDVTGYLYGGDRTRKTKLWDKQKRGKKRLKERGRVTISPEVFKELLKK